MIRRYARSLLLPWVVLAWTSCDVLTSTLPKGAQRIAPPSVYATWWSMVESCSGISAPLASVQWYVVPEAWTVPLSGYSDVLAYWSEQGNRIVVAGEEALDGSVVRHEMLHALIRQAGHPRDAFVTKCGGVIDCNQVCLADAGTVPAVSPGTPNIRISQLDIEATISPAIPVASADSGCFTITLTVTNRAPFAGVVALGDNDPAFRESGVMQYVLRLPSGETDYGGPTVVDETISRFEVNETKRYVFDFRADSAQVRNGIPPGKMSLIAVGYTAAGPWVNLGIVPRQSPPTSRSPSQSIPPSN